MWYPSLTGGGRTAASRAWPRALAALGLTAALLFPPFAAHAQEQPDPAANARLHLGPLALTPTMFTNIGIDTNVFNAAVDPKQDMVATFKPQAEGWLRLGRARLNGTGLVDFVYFNRYESERSINPSFQGKLELPFNRLRLYGGGAYTRSSARLNAEVDVRAPHTDSITYAGGEVRVGTYTFVGAEAQRSRFAYDDVAFPESRLREVLNRHSDSYSFSLRHKLTPLTTIALTTQNVNDRFDFTPARDSDSVRVTPGVEFSPFALLSGKAYVGVRRFMPKDPQIPDYTGLVASIDLGYTLLGTTRFQFRASRDVAYSVEVVHPYYLQSEIGGSVLRRISDTWDVGGTISVQRLAYRSLVPTSPLPTGALDPTTTGGVTPPLVAQLPPTTGELADLLGGRTDRLLIWGAGLGYRVGPDTRIGGNADYYRRYSVLENRTYKSVRITLLLSYGF